MNVGFLVLCVLFLLNTVNLWLKGYVANYWIQNGYQIYDVSFSPFLNFWFGFLIIFWSFPTYLAVKMKILTCP